MGSRDDERTQLNVRLNPHSCRVSHYDPSRAKNAEISTRGPTKLMEMPIIPSISWSFTALNTGVNTEPGRVETALISRGYRVDAADSEISGKSLHIFGIPGSLVGMECTHSDVRRV